MNPNILALFLAAIFIFLFAYFLNEPDIEKCQNGGVIVRGVWHLVCVKS